ATAHPRLERLHLTVLLRRPGTGRVAGAPVRRPRGLVPLRPAPRVPGRGRPADAPGRGSPADDRGGRADVRAATRPHTELAGRAAVGGVRPGGGPPRPSAPRAVPGVLVPGPRHRRPGRPEQRRGGGGSGRGCGSRRGPGRTV